MFTHATDASKLAFVRLARYLVESDFGIIDCQMRTAHLATFGAREIPRAEFLALIASLVRDTGIPGPWRLD
jgi:leucyl/phenylalanyl-tRNA--protein transferase